MKLKNKYIYYTVGLLLAFITLIPPLPRALKYLIALIPILAFGCDLTLSYMKDFFEKKYISKYLVAIIVGLGLIVTGKLSYAAITMIFYSAATHYFDKAVVLTRHGIDKAARITAGFARHRDNGKIPVNQVTPGMPLILQQGDIIPCDCKITSGEAAIDYTNIFGSGEPRKVKAGSDAFSGGTVQSGSATAVAFKNPAESLAALISAKTKKAHTPSQKQKKFSSFAALFEPMAIGVAVLFFIILMIATKDFPVSVNIASIFLVASTSMGYTAVMPLLSHNAVLSARRRGVIFADIFALEQCSELQTYSPNESLPEETLVKIEETGVIIAKNGNHRLDAVAYRNAAQIEADKNPCFKFALGFFSPNADAQVLDAKAERVAGAVRTAKNYRSVFYQNLVCLIVEKLALIALAFLLNITPAAAIVIEFAAWMLCLANATKDL